MRLKSESMGKTRRFALLGKGRQGEIFNKEKKSWHGLWIGKQAWADLRVLFGTSRIFV